MPTVPTPLLLVLWVDGVPPLVYRLIRVEGKALPGKGTMKEGISGLTVPQIVAQSAACHPDWSVQDHLDYLRYEEGVEAPGHDVSFVLRVLAAGPPQR